MKKILFLFLWTFPVLAGQTEVYFTPSPDCENQIIKRINETEVSIDAAVYSITNDAITDALINAHNRGIKIRLLTDRTQAGNKSSTVKELENIGIDLMRHAKYKIQHDKFAVFDGKKGVTGSYNWTNAATYKNAENCLFFDDASVQKYEERFEHLWQLNKDAYRKKELKNRQ